MEQHDPSQSRNQRQSYGGQQQQQSGRSSTQGQFASPGSVERVRQSSYLQQSPVSAPPVGRPGESQPLFGFTPTAQYGAGPSLQPSPLQYEDPGRQQSQQYAQYPSNMLYGMAQSQTTPTARSAYAPVQQYGQRPGSGSETMGTQFGVPQGAQYYLAGQPGPTSELAAQNMPAQYPQPESYPGSMPPIAPGYAASMMDPSQQTTFSPYAQQTQYAPQPQAPSTDQAFERYQSQRQFDLTEQVTQTNRPLGENQSIMSIQAVEQITNELVSLCDEIEKHGLVDYQMGVAEEEVIDRQLIS